MNEDSTPPKPHFFSNVFLQILPVMLGVFLGLWANNWNEDRKHAQLQTQVLQKIKQDIATNKKQLENVLGYHKSLGDSATAILERGDLNILTKTRLEIGRDNPYDIWKGTRTSPLRDAGYQTAIVMGTLADIDIDLVALLSEINQQQQHYATMSNNYLLKAISTKTDILMIDQILYFSSFSIDITYVEEDLIKLYNLALEKLNKIE